MYARRDLRWVEDLEEKKLRYNQILFIWVVLFLETAMGVTLGVQLGGSAEYVEAIRR